MKTKIINENVEYTKKIKSFEVEFSMAVNEGDLLETKTVTLNFSKMEEDGSWEGNDNDVQFDKASQDIFNELDDYNQGEIMDYINDLKI